MKKPFLFDMESNDPDDFLTLVLLLGHPEVDLRSVTITPGTREQVGLVRQVLTMFDRSDVRVGAADLDYKGDCISVWHYNAFPDLRREESSLAEVGHELLDELFVPGTTLVCGAALRNLGGMLEHGRGIPRGRLFVQGGFAGEGVVPPEKQLDKFKGRVSCPSFNLDGDKASVRRVIESVEMFEDLRFVSKNVCHGILFNQDMRDDCARLVSSSTPAHELSWALIMQGMDFYLQKKPRGKAFHDPFAACCAIEPSIALWERVQLTREKEGWTSTPDATSKVRIVVSYDHPSFLEVLTGSSKDR